MLHEINTLYLGMYVYATAIYECSYVTCYSSSSYIVFITGLVLIEQATSQDATMNDKTVANR